ncbi:hypothetical protein HanXRQr2_Chr12g0551651 [Helianthus annuus]|uniref:Uncharacterized protein n=1 Tax=Helianthus annuus TaxID=4232 RepID=A0A9K3HI48_HELAN|nr:hypothetical protein HanXRQr2_Chr12g0551651 [Helianthus annuus]KAJ0863527.1 hypothetical protein HanPSC8_Chr12g0531101 [Helianthus annuus]
MRPDMSEISGGIGPPKLLEARERLTRLWRWWMSEERVPVRLRPERLRSVT